ncbi:MAG: HAMP domain-containing histidine kinase [Candidatus Marinimicrobia bacterium]|nr:HAMP domain-containing histidine kinase [Candidatus Neomarinimicrobiota bacterium]MBT4362611.1 HAMP domain-containing histidine kinase [Candidatus Neomarinimicrobiota bacterium]MBT4713458.1 HAMP domain-containing histidine kinase [Candidatus Neomarinimicrobiota bacterium]MBT4944628.1 HAMP domain-containing histidine kinase [Candidatus Neomarinimicrobiota bacterium]MBT5270690.1 HAMP domain-containing histidine kinase [Candidatus Neomarinimicrobiota bacterium]
MSAMVDLSIRSSMIREDHAELTIAITKVQDVPGVGAIRIFNDEGEIRHFSPGALHSGMEHTPMTPCAHCHSEVDHSQWGMPGTCIYNRDADAGRNMIVLSPIMSTPECRSSGCHQTHIDSEVLGFLEIELPLDELDGALSQLLYEYFGLILLFLVLVMGALLFFVKRRIHKPLKRIVDASRAVSTGNLSVRVNVQPNDLIDIHEVGLALNTMLESINESSRELHQWSNELENKVRTKSEDIARTQNEIYQIERLASLGRLSSSVAHEINNPLAGVLTYAKLVSRILQNPELTEEKKEAVLKHLEMIQSETKRCGNIVKGLLNFSRDGSQKFDEVSVNEVLAETEQLIQHSFQISDVILATDFSATRDQIRGNGNQIIQACLAVLTNALEAVSPGPDSQVTYRSYNPDMEHITIEIKDNGIGISEADQEHIFEPFFSSKKEMSGIGLGLAVTYGILEQHNAKVAVDSAPGAGTSLKFTFELSSGRA